MLNTGVVVCYFLLTELNLRSLRFSFIHKKNLCVSEICDAHAKQKLKFLKSMWGGAIQLTSKARYTFTAGIS
jgi:hypothetical protein